MNDNLVCIDGSQGEGGGQMLRSALALSLWLQRPFSMQKIRAGRKKPGLLHQHLTAVRAAAAVGQAEVEGAELGSRRLEFRPGEVVPGDYFFSIGTAGSTTLVAHALIPALLAARGPSSLTIEGGTHNRQAPPLEHLQLALAPLWNRIGPQAGVRLLRHGFYPAGGGRVRIETLPPGDGGWRPLQLPIVDEPADVRAIALCCKLPEHVGRRELDAVQRQLRLPDEALELRQVDDAATPGNALLLICDRGGVCDVFCGFGERGKPAEQVASEALSEAVPYLRSRAAVGPHLADQLLLPLTMAGGGEFFTNEVTLHTETNLDVIRKFVEIPAVCERVEPDLWRVAIGSGVY